MARKKNTNLSRRDRDTLEFIRSFMLKNNVTPTIREISDGIGITSAASAHYHLRNLISYGYIIPYGKSGARYIVKGIKYTEDSSAPQI